MMKQKRSLKFWNLRIAILCLCALYGFMLTSNAQWTTDTKKESQESKSDLKNMIQAPVTNVPALEGPVDPDKYFIGPSDVLSVNIWTSPQLNFTLVVTPECTLIVPTVGEVRVADLTLSAAKKKIISEIKKKYLAGDPTVTLMSPRDFIVNVLGNVRFPGKYKMNATERVDKLIQAANVKKVTEDKLLTGTTKTDENPNYRPESSSKRNIVLRRRNGSIMRVDLLQFFSANNEQLNPFLLDGDEVFVPTLDNFANVFAVYGAVRAPGRFEFIDGDSLCEGINLAYGFIQRSNLDSIELVRFDTTTELLSSIVVNAKELYSGSPKNLALNPGDRIIVKDKVDLREDYRVFIEGEVLHPGIYPITKNSTRLFEVLQQAGGLTQNASLKSAELLRKTVVVDDGQLDRMVRQKSDITPEDNIYVTIEGDTKVRRDNVNVDFEKLFSTKGESQDVVLQSEDRIVIPSIRKTVYVFGQVTVPGNLPYIADKDVDYYIACAGGYTDDAQKGDVAIIKWTTRQWFEPGKTQIQEGDFIWVPPVVRRPASYWLAIIGQTASIISVAASIVLVTIQLGK